MLPLRILYLFSDFMYLLIMYVVPYRKKVVYNNLKNAFPEKSEEEIRKIAKSFYRYFCDFIIEIIKSINISPSSLMKRLNYVNPEVVNDQYDKGNNVVLVSGHYGNWEWLSTLNFVIKHQFIYAARVLHNSFSDTLINNLRQKYGALFVRMEDTYRSIIKRIKHDEKIMIWLLADQRPPKNAEYWTTFLNQDTAFYLGAGKMVKKLNLSLVFLDIQRVKRGRYDIHFELLTEGAVDMDEYQITEMHIRKLEEVIRKKPDYWLWSHKRWKHKKPVE